jgi:hypothetical protein
MTRRATLRAASTVLAGALGAATLVMLTAGPASAHEQRKVGRWMFTVGWGEEPLYAGAKNSVQLVLDDAAGNPVKDLGDTLKVTVVYGTQSVTLPLETTFDPDSGEGTPGDYRAWFIPTAPGNYTFHFTGTIHGDRIDESFTSSDTTFDPVKDPAEVEFPSKPLTTAQLSTRVARDGARIDSAKSSASTATILGIVGIVLGAIGAAAGVGFGVRSRKMPA